MVRQFTKLLCRFNHYLRSLRKRNAIRKFREGYKYAKTGLRSGKCTAEDLEFEIFESLKDEFDEGVLRAINKFGTNSTLRNMEAI
jgi:hypothetical protein